MPPYDKSEFYSLTRSLRSLENAENTEKIYFEERCSPFEVLFFSAASVRDKVCAFVCLSLLCGYFADISSIFFFQAGTSLAAKMSMLPP